MKDSKLISFKNRFFALCKKILSCVVLFFRWLKAHIVIGRKTKIALYAVVGVILVAQIYFGVMIYAFKSTGKVTRIAAKIVPYPLIVANYDVITYNDFLNEKDYILHFYKATNQDSGDLSGIDAQITNQLIDNKLIATEALLNHVSVSKSDINATFDDIANQNGGQTQVQKVLNDLYGLSVNNFKSLIKTQLLQSKVDQKLIARVKVSHILIKADNTATKEQVEAARIKILGIKTEINNGLSFADAAKKYSEDTSSAAQGGSLDPFAKGEMVEQFSNMAFKTPVGSISDPVQTQYGWHIIKVESRTGKFEETFDEWLTSIKNKSLVISFIKY